jgi:hypothetical protein
MSAPSYPPLVEAYLVLEQPRQRLVHWTAVLAPLDDERAPPLASVAAYYDPGPDHALIGLRYDELALGPSGLAYVVEVALLAEIGMVQPAELSEGDRRRFLSERLPQCSVIITDQRGVVSALGELIRRVREQRGRPTRDRAARAGRPPTAPRIPLLAAAAARARGTDDDPVLLVQPASTRDELDRMRREQQASLEAPAQRAPKEGGRESRDTLVDGLPADSGAPETAEAPVPLVQRRIAPPPVPDAAKARTRSAHVVPRTITPAAPPAQEAHPASPAAGGEDRAREPTPPTAPLAGADPARAGGGPRPPRAPTVQMDPLEAQKLAAAGVSQAGPFEAITEVRGDARRAALAPPAHLDRAGTPVGARRSPAPASLPRGGGAGAGSPAPLPSLGAPPVRDPSDPLAAALGTVEPFPPEPLAAPGIIYARYLRSGRWVPLRVGALSLRGAALMTGALPRLRDRVEVALAFGEHRALIRGPVHKISSAEETAQTGASSFSVAFELDETSRPQLTALLQAARAARVTIKPPPARGNRRYPVEWPVALGTVRGAIRGEALDVSRGGMFVRPVHALALDTDVTFTAVLDDSGPPVCGRARVVRFVDADEARVCAAASGYGLQLLDMMAPDRARWTSFLSRVERRGEKRVLLGAAVGRLAELQTALAAAGYAVVGAADPDRLAALASEDRAVDACLIDAGWIPPSPSGNWAESLFPTRVVPCVSLRDEALASGGMDPRRVRAAIDQVLGIA